MSLSMRLLRAFGFLGLAVASGAALVVVGQPFDPGPEIGAWLDPSAIGFLGLAAALALVATRGPREPAAAPHSIAAAPAVSPPPVVAASPTTPEPVRPPAPAKPAPARPRGPAYTLHFNHEVRTPITAILGYTEMLSAADASPTERVEFLKSVQRNCQALARLADETLAFARTESGEITIHHDVINLVELFNEPVLLVGSDAAAKRLAIRVEPTGSVPERVSADALYTRQIMIHLLQTAIQLSDAGEILVTFHLDTAEGEPTPRMTVDVYDTAPSLTPEIRRALFDPSSEATLRRVDLLGGTGLRLAIAQRLAERLGGTVEPGPATASHGSFRLVIPTAAAPDTAWIDGADLFKLPRRRQTTGQTVPLRGRVLVVESAPEIGWLLRALVARRGVEIESCSGSLEAWDRLMRPAESTEPWDAVVVDVDDPDVDGTLLVQRLLLDGVSVPIVAVGTLDSLPSDSEPRVTILTKPARGLALYDVVRPLLRPAA